MSWAQFGLGIAVFGGLEYKAKITRLLRRPEFLIWIGFYGLFLLSGLKNSGGNEYYLNDIRTKMPLWVLPAALGLMPALTFRDLKLILHFFLVSLLIASVFVIGIRLGFGTERAEDFRDLSPFVSHIRLAISVVLGVFLSFYLTRRSSENLRFFSVYLYRALIVYLLFILLILNTFTAWPVFLGALLAVGFYQFLKITSVKFRVGLGVTSVVFTFLVVCYLVYEYQDFKYKEPLPKSPELKTASGNIYTHDSVYPFYENGHAVGMYVCEDELRAAWRKRSTMNLDSLDLRGQPLLYTLKRYLSSRGFRKDKEGVESLSNHDIQSVENGYANYLYAESFAVRGRLREIFWEFEMYRSSKDPNDKSLSTRIELWKASIQIVSGNPLGVGSGNVRKALERQLEEQHSGLRYYRTFGPHNQYFATAIALGIPGMMWMLFCLMIPVFKVQKSLKLPSIICSGILLVACVNEDMFETQTAVTFAVFWILLWNGVGKEPFIESEI